MSAHRCCPVIDFIIALNRVTRSPRSFTIDVLAFGRRQCAEIIARVAVVAIDARRIFREESILAHVFVNGLNLAIFALV